MAIKKAPAKKRPRLADVAALAGVSPTAASLVLNDAPDARLSAETRARIHEAASTLNYRVNIAARGLAIQRTHTIGFVSDEIATTEFAGGLISGSQQVASRNGMHQFVVETGGVPATEASALDALIDRDVEGIIFGVMSARQVDPPESLSTVPTVLMNCFTSDGRLPTVHADERHGGRVATEVLLDAGHRRIAFINGKLEGRGSWASSQRLAGYREALDMAGIEADPTLVRHGTWQPDSGYAIAKELLGLPEPPTALFCGNDRMAFGAYEAVRELGLKVPSDVSVVGYDNQPLSGFMFPPLTTVDLPHEEIGRVAGELLQQQIADQPLPPLPVLVRGRVVSRASVAPPRP